MERKTKREGEVGKGRESGREREREREGEGGPKMPLMNYSIHHCGGTGILCAMKCC